MCNMIPEWGGRGGGRSEGGEGGEGRGGGEGRVGGLRQAL